MGAGSGDAVEEVYLAFVDEFEDKLAEEGVLPGKPLAGKLVCVVHVERFVYESGLGVGSEEHCDAVADFVVVLRGERFHHYTHGPSHVVADVGASDAFSCGSAEEVGVILAPHVAAGVLIDGVVDVYIAEICHGEKAGHIGVVHEVGVAEAVYLEGVDFAIFGVVIDGMLLEGSLYLVGKSDAASGKGGLLVDSAEDFGGLAEARHGHEVGRHEILECGGVVRGSESRHDEAAAAHGRAVAVVYQSVGSLRGVALETV